jgi:uncharacterized membrane protein (DUF373 family)
MTEEKETLVNDPLSKLFKKIGVTGIAAAILTMSIGLVVIFYPLQWEEFKLLIGLFLFVLGLINLTGYVVSIVSRHRAMKTYVETETMKELKEI